jgi:hypothetical protein
VRYLTLDHARLLRAGRTCRAARVRAYAPPLFPWPRTPVDMLGVLLSVLVQMGARA